MSEPGKIKEFPDISNKLTAPTKKSLFERQKAEAEAKRRKEAEETAAVYEDFVKSFEDDGTKDTGFAGRGGGSAFGGRGGGGVGMGLSGPPKRHFGQSSTRGKSGPGSLGPPPSLARKRGFDGSYQAEAGKESRLFAFENSSSGPMDAATAFRDSDDDDDTATSKAAERAAPKPTLHLSSLPPATSPAVIKSLVSSKLTVDSVRILPPPPPNSSERRSLAAIVTLTKDTPASDIDATVNELQNKYLGWGFYLTLSRHLSSAALESANPTSSLLGSVPTSQPFGAKPQAPQTTGPLSRAPPPNDYRGFAPPQSYGGPNTGYPGRGPNPQSLVNVACPSDIKQLRLIHKTVESILKYGPEFEALLMTRPNVQREEKWAWIWDPRSTGGVWYRWRLWELITGYADDPPKHRSPLSIFEGATQWAPPEKGLPFEFTTNVDEFLSDSAYDSSEDDSGDEGQRRLNQSGAPPENVQEGERIYLNPLQKARLTFLLARLPTTTAKLQKADVASVTCFAISHASQGAEEVVDMLVANVEKPFAWGGANADRQADEDGDDAEKKLEKDDISSSKLIGLYLVSDILSTSSTSGVRHAWRYRQLFETAMKNRKTFEGLGRLEKERQWGLLRCQKWQRSVGNVLDLWEQWSAFSQAAQEHFVQVFQNPPSTDVERSANEAEAEKTAKQAPISAAKSKWKTVDVIGNQSTGSAGIFNEPTASFQSRFGGDGTVENGKAGEGIDGAPLEEDVDGTPMEDVDGVPIEDVDGDPMEDVDGVPIEEDVDGTPMEDVESEHLHDKLPMKTNTDPPESNPTSLRIAPFAAGGTAAARARRERPRAVDMFADDSGEE